MEENVNWSDVLIGKFGDYKSEEYEEKWNEVKSSLNQGDTVKGIVFARAPFGVWVDLGLKFPALLEIIVIEGMNREMYKNDEYYPVGSTVEATVSDFRDFKKQIYLKQTEWPTSKNGNS